ncbi:hypothetical protein Gotur_007291 [Gossypium turneri]
MIDQDRICPSSGIKKHQIGLCKCDYSMTCVQLRYKRQKDIIHKILSQKGYVEPRLLVTWMPLIACNVRSVLVLQPMLQEPIG